MTVVKANASTHTATTAIVQRLRFSFIMPSKAEKLLLSYYGSEYYLSNLTIGSRCLVQQR